MTEAVRFKKHKTNCWRTRSSNRGRNMKQIESGMKPSKVNRLLANIKPTAVKTK